MSRRLFRITRYPKDWDIVSEQVLEFKDQMNDIVLTQQKYGDRERKLSQQLAELNFQCSAFVFEKYYVEEAISRECYQFCVKNHYVDAALIAQWKKKGTEFLCCVSCAMRSAAGTQCICRVPRELLDADMRLQGCQKCGCHGCASSDKMTTKTKE